MRFALLFSLSVSVLVSCDIGKLTVGTTSKILERAQPGLQQESDYEMARQAIPGALKTVEGFWVVDPDNKTLIKILTEGYCQYGTAFVEDDWEAAKLASPKDVDLVDYHNARATNMFTRCLNYALRSLGDDWQKNLFGKPEDQLALIKRTGADKRTPMMFAGLALGSLINHNQLALVSYVSVVQAIMERVIELDNQHPPANLQHRALPFIALGMLNSAVAKAMGGNPDKAKAMFEQALEITKNPACSKDPKACPNGADRFLLARVLMAYQVGRQTNDRKFFHEQLKQVLMTPPSVWPEQRLANEVAHRKARRYLSKEKEIF